MTLVLNTLLMFLGKEIEEGKITVEEASETLIHLWMDIFIHMTDDEVFGPLMRIMAQEKGMEQT
jgi:hypothetical protein